ncbi:MAG: hypothetical protein L0027_16460 [Candidatus Rokubacteria bacterium]|nr:hypothetical protein [Candidatus Rokubacteria bacterium]
MSDPVAPSCPQGHVMIVRSRFRFDHEPGDTPEDRAGLERLRALEIALGAEVTLWRCLECGVADARFQYPQKASAP